jgi:PQQ-dependent catabolism-associated CXXCW motif protein
MSTASPNPGACWSLVAVALVFLLYPLAAVAQSQDPFLAAPAPPTTTAKPPPHPRRPAPPRRHEADMPGTADAPPPSEAPSVPRAAPRPVPAVARLPPIGPTYDGEAFDYGMAPVAALRTGSYEGPTPTRVEGAQTIATSQLQAMLSSGHPPVLIDALGGNQTVSLPGAVWSPGIGMGVGLQDRLQQAFARELERLTGGNRAAPVVIFCLSKTCWLSYNATLRAVALGYRSVFWYRGGRNAWRAAGLPMTPVKLYTPAWPTIAVAPPGPGVPAALARFSGVWFGQWGGRNYAVLAVKAVQPDGAAAIEYWWQPATGLDFLRLPFSTAWIQNGVLAFGSIRLGIDARDPSKAMAQDRNSVGVFLRR